MPDDTHAPGPPSDRARVRRLADKARYDRATIDAILDAGLIAHVGLIAADGSPVVIPTAYARQGDRVLVHGSAASRMIRTGAGGAAMSLAVTHLDALLDDLAADVQQPAGADDDPSVTGDLDIPDDLGGLDDLGDQA